MPGVQALFAQIALGGWEVAKVQHMIYHMGLIPTQNSFFSIHTELMKQNLLSVLRMVKYTVLFCN